MDYAMDFKAIWPLLRKEGWTWKAATGIQIHHNYLKPGCKLRGGKRGVDYFNGEDELLAYIRTEKELCARLGISNVMVRSQAQATQSTVVHEGPLVDKPAASPRPPDQQVKIPAKPIATNRKTPSTKPPKPKKCTKKQIAEEADKRRKELAAFAKVWGEENGTAKPPGQDENLSATSSTSPISQTSREDNADTIHTAASNADLVSTSSRAHADTDHVEADANADIDDIVVAEAVTVDMNPETESSPTESRRTPRRYSLSEDEEYLPDEADGDDDEDDEDPDQRNSTDDEEEKDEENVRDNLNHESCNEQLLRDGTCGTLLRFNYMDPLDPNITGDTGDTALDTDGEGEEDSAEAFIGTIIDADSELSHAESCEGDILQRELSRVTKVMDAADLERLHMQIQASSEVFDDGQLDQMNVDGWEVIPENVEAEIVDDPSVDKIILA
ncbi:hypothetical protein PF007_g4962 [Phytophthora fragariae]|uniref:Uncharacterized protein n=1 Tax=Phytophthora fragariae TaxID=53985 RepID=A0A6A3T3R3_9STRA|nr:hypothetical protein PF007_g4962 [Phytophthora fragariae]